KCAFCLQSSRVGATAESLRQYFTLLLEVYSNQEPEGGWIVDLLQEDWEVFNDVDLVENKGRIELLRRITGVESVTEKAWARPRSWGEGLIDEWKIFKRRIKSENKWFVDGEGHSPYLIYESI
ncbi:MAG: HEPN-associated N-terminal domain-containing protein, partial [Mixta calida]|nr:HEPN-associated N-terminal domain-containing protein [Mixta calida]